MYLTPGFKTLRKPTKQKGAEMRQSKWNARAVMGAFAVSAATVLAIATGCKDSNANEARQSAAADQGAASSGVAAGSHVDGKNFKIDAAAVGACKAGAECKLAITLTAAGDYHINKEYPYKFKAEGAGVEFLGGDAAGKNTFSKSAGDFVIDASSDPAKSGTMTVKFKPAAKGSSTISGTFKLSVCSAQNCQLETQEISATVPVTS